MNAKPHIDELPGGTVTFLFTDIQGSTQLLLELREVYAELLAQHHALLRAAISNWHGQEVDTQGDAFFVSFARATQAVRCVVEIHRALAEQSWPQGAEVRVRMGLHTGEPLVAGEGYVGMDVHRAARIAHVGHGGQVLLSETSAALVLDDLPDGVSLLDLGRHRLKDMRRPEHIRQLVIEGLPFEFPPLTSLEALPPETYLDPGAVKLPAFLDAEVEERPAPVFVGRERELASLDEYLERALTGQGSMVFLTGGPGRGKSALLEAFARRVQAKEPDLLVTLGNGKAQSGVGDPYLPFREALGMLTGEVQTRWASGSISRRHAEKLWGAGPQAAQAIVDHGANLVGVLVSAKGLVARISTAVPDQRSLIGTLRAVSERERASPAELEQRALFEQYQSVLYTLSERGPLVLLLDDLQWADSASIDLLFHLARGLESSRILLVGAYRPEEVTLGRGGERHPLESVLSEVKRQYGQVWLDLSDEEQGDGRGFVDDLLDSQPNRLSIRFRDGLYRHTGGHPLFTVELLRDLQERGDLAQDEDGKWVEGPELDWDTLPARVEGVIEARIGRLEGELRDTLTVASVEGEDFTAQVVAQVQEVGERYILRKLSTELEKRHRLVHGQGETLVGEVMLSRYHFTHSVIQRYLYNSLSPGEKRLLNGEVAGVLERLYEGRTDEICAQLARHYWESGQREKAVEYLLLGGDRARNLYAHQEAIQAYQAALEILKEQGENERAARTLMKLGLAYHTAFDYQRSKQAYDQAFELWQQVAPSPVVGPATPAAHTLRLDMEHDPDTLDPGYSFGVQSAIIINSLFSGLVQWTPDHAILPDSAHRWEITDDGRRYTFHLRPDLRWSDGLPVTAGDFEYAWKRVLDPQTDSNTAHMLYDLKGAWAYHQGLVSDAGQVGVKAVDLLTLVVELEEPAGYFLSLISNVCAFPVPRHVLERFGDDWTAPGKIVTNGPFLLEAWQPEKSLHLARNPHFHGFYQGNLERVELYNLSGMAWQERLALYKDGRFDTISVENHLKVDIKRLQDRFPGELRPRPRLGVTYLVCNTRLAPFDDPRIREALFLAVNVEDYARVVTEGTQPPASGGLIPLGLPGYSPGISLPYDPGRARRLLAEAGYPGGRKLPEITALILPGYVPSLEYLQSRWREELGFSLTWEVSDLASILDKLDERLYISIAGWIADYPDPHNFLQVGFGAYTHEWSGWHNDAYEMLLDQAKGSLDQAERMQLYQTADKMLIDEVVLKPLTYGGDHTLVKPWVKSLDTLLSNIYKDVTIEPGAHPERPAQPQVYPATNVLRVTCHSPTSLDPSLVDDNYSVSVFDQLFSGLVELTPGMDVVPDVARSWEVLEDGLKYVFHLRDNVYWSDGQPLTAGDFEYTWKRILNSATQSRNVKLLFDIKGAFDYHQEVVSDPAEIGVHALDDFTLQVELEGQTGYFLYLLSCSALFPIPRHVVETYGAAWTQMGNIVTNGPFLLEEWRPGEIINLARNPGYHGSFRGNLQRIELHFSEYGQNRMEMYVSHDYDILDLWGFLPQEMDRAQLRHTGEYISAPRPGTGYVGFNVRQPPVDDVRVRQALALALDKEHLAQVVLKGYYFPATGGFVPPGIPGHTEGINLPYDPDRARTLLAEAGYPEGRAFPTLRGLSFAGAEAWAEYTQAQWGEQLGIQIEWQIDEWGQFYNNLAAGNHQVFTLAWQSDYPDPDGVLRASNTQGFTNWQHEAYDQLVERARRTLDQEHRLELYRQAEQILVEQASIIPLTYIRYHLLVKPWVKNLAIDFGKFWSWKNVIIEPH